MPDREAPVSIPKHSFAAGEVAPGFYGRQDLQKYGSGCTVMRNWYIDARGGATVRPGSQVIGHPKSTGYARLIPFQFSPDVGQSFMLVFSASWIKFIKNPGTPAHPNSSNAGFVQSGGVDYALATPYVEADLRGLHVVQLADVMWITSSAHPRMKLSRIADNNWTLTTISTTPSIAAPVMTSVTISPSPGGTPTPTVTTRYMYCVSAIGADGAESLPSAPLISSPGINIGVVEGTVTLVWAPVAAASYYKVWKALPAHADRVPLPFEQFGFAGYSYGTSFTDSNIVADFTKAPIRPGDPFAPAPITGYSISNSGSGYLPDSTTITVTDASGTGAVVYPVFSTNVAGTGASIVGLYIANPGSGYTAPTFTAVGAGASFAATGTVGPGTGLEPSAVGLFQQRLVYANTANKPNSLFAGRPGRTDDFRKTNPPVDDDAFELEIFDQQVSRTNWMRSLPGGLLLGTNAGIIQLTGGSSAAGNPVAVSASNAVVVPQSFSGAADIPPIVIDRQILYVQSEGTVRDLQYNFYANIYTGDDITVLSNHLFTASRVVDWAYADVPNKAAWSIMDNGNLLSLTYLKAQEIAGWARHDTFGTYEAVAQVQEGPVNAVYFSVIRNGSRWIERQTQQHLNQLSDAWQLDGAVGSTSNYPSASLVLTGTTGTVGATASAAVFAIGDVGKVINAITSRGTITGFTSSTAVTVAIDPTQPFVAGPGGSVVLATGIWRMDPVLSSIGGLGDYNGTVVYAVVDGLVQGPFTVSGASITLTTPGSQVVVGYKFQAQLQPLYVEDPGNGTLQGKRKKVAAATVRVQNAKGLKYGPYFTSLLPWVDNTSSTDAQPVLPYSVSGLFSGDQRMWLDQDFGMGGFVCIQQDDPYPATVLMVVPEVAQGDVY